MFIQSFLHWLGLEVMTAVCTLPDFSVTGFIIILIYKSCQLWGKITFFLPTIARVASQTVNIIKYSVHNFVPWG